MNVKLQRAWEGFNWRLKEAEATAITIRIGRMRYLDVCTNGTIRFRRLAAGLIAGMLCAVAIASAQDGVVVSDSAFVARDSVAFFGDTVEPRVRIGMQAGFTLANAHTVPDIAPATRTGLLFGLRCEMEFLHPVYLVIEPQYVQKGARSNFQLPNGQRVSEVYAFDYVSVPITFKALFNIGRPSLTITGGLNPNFLLTARHTQDVGTSEPEFDVSRGLTAVDLGLEIGGGVEYPISGRLSITADIRYTHGLVNNMIPLGLRDDQEWRSRDWSFSTGFMWVIRKRYPVLEP